MVMLIDVLLQVLMSPLRHSGRTSAALQAPKPEPEITTCCRWTPWWQRTAVMTGAGAAGDDRHAIRYVAVAKQMSCGYSLPARRTVMAPERYVGLAVSTARHLLGPATFDSVSSVQRRAGAVITASLPPGVPSGSQVVISGSGLEPCKEPARFC